MSDKLKYRILRILEYVGDRDWIDEQISKRGVKGSYVLSSGRGVVREAIVGDVSELLDPIPPKRSLGDVLNQMLVHVPVGHPLIQKIDWLAKDIRYKAPEQLIDCWAEVGAVLGAELGPPQSLTEDWQKQVIAIFMNTEQETVNGR